MPGVRRGMLAAEREQLGRSDREFRENTPSRTADDRSAGDPTRARVPDRWGGQLAGDTAPAISRGRAAGGIAGGRPYRLLLRRAVGRPQLVAERMADASEYTMPREALMTRKAKPMTTTAASSSTDRVSIDHPSGLEPFTISWNTRRR